ncbi:MAG: hypothetical protein JW932_16435, partial [Deltaproteobacteria bacterium]|nr:hypothetical protein [Deltaproteobacteria bacterium]
FEKNLNTIQKKLDNELRLKYLRIIVKSFLHEFFKFLKIFILFIFDFDAGKRNFNKLPQG